MFPRIILTLLFLINLGLYVWFAVDSANTPGLEIAIELFEQPVDSIEEAEIRADILGGLAERALKSETRLYWTRHLLLINGIAFLLSIVFLSLIPRPNDKVEASAA